MFPSEFTGYERNELNEHITQFGKDFSRAFRESVPNIVDTTDFGCLVTHISNLLYRYTWCIPSNTQEVFPDVSLFDHLKTTAALASCLYLYHSDTNTLNEREIKQTRDKQFCLVVGDLSGIQDYIFDIASEVGVGGGIARRLRARSLYVQLCGEVAAHLVLRQLRLPIVIHTVMNSGGRFYLLLPNLSETKVVLAETQRFVDKWFLHELNGELALNLAWVEFGDKGFEAGGADEGGFGRVLEEVNHALNSRKQKRFTEALSSGRWLEDSFIIDLSYEGKESCVSCKKFPETKDGLCTHCQRDREIGSELPGAKYLAFFDSHEGHIPVLGDSVAVWNHIPTGSEPMKPYLVMKLNDPDLIDLARYPAASRYLATHVALADNCAKCQKAESSIATFECLAGRSRGEALLGFLKIDVDRLGETFVYGLKGKETSVDTISRVSTLSRMLDIFFSGWVEHLTREGQDFYTIFSGGDDLFLVGPWDKVVRIAGQIREDFAKFTGNPTLTLSAGVVMARHNFPISSAARAGEEALEQSKKEGRNRITVLRHTLTWDEWAMVEAECQRLYPLIKLPEVPSAFLYNLLRFAEMWERFSKKADMLGLRYHPLLAYSVSRNLDPRKTPALYQWVEKLLAIRPGDGEQKWLLDNLGLIASLLIYSKRGGGE